MHVAAIGVLRRFSDARGHELFKLGFWPLVEQHLANLYRQTGNEDRADAIEKKVMSALTVADADYSLAAQLLAGRASFIFYLNVTLLKSICANI